MPVTAYDIRFYLSGGSTNTDPNLSLGGPISQTEIVSGQLNNLFDDVSAVESGAGDVEYRCIYIKNTHSVSSLVNARIWIDQDTLSTDDEIDIAIDPSGVGGTVPQLADESTAPPNVVFSHPTSYDTGLAIGDIGPGQYVPIWFRRTVQPGAQAFPNNTFSFRIRGETA